MKTLATLVVMLFSSSLLADWNIGGAKVDLVPCPQSACLVSRSCMNKSQSTCLALKAAARKVKSKSGPGGTNPGSAVCTEQHNGKVYLAMDEKKRTVALCGFADQSFITLDSLWVW